MAPKPTRSRQLAAIGAIVLVVAVVLTAVLSATSEVRRLTASLVFVLVAAAAAWVALSRTGLRRTLAVAVLALAAIAFVVAGLSGGAKEALLAVAQIGLLAVAYGLSRHALGLTTGSLKASETPGQPVGPARRGTLIMNLKSGGGKAQQFGLVDECRKRGIEPIVLEPGDDLTVLARQAVDGGADVIGMAGGDGSQALVAAVAAERGVPMVVVPAGTRNHLALDLGLDRDDVVGALDAYGVASERVMDLAEVNGTVFVNNVSLGLYATIVSSPDYRDAKVDTTLSMLPKLIGPGTTPFDLRFIGPDGERYESAHLIQISNNPYRKGSGSRPRLDSGLLGMFSLEVPDDKAMASLIAALAAGRPERYSGFAVWTATTFDVDSAAPIDVGLDGEALTLDPPLHFRIRPGALRVRLPTHAIGLSPAARTVSPRAAARGLWQVARGHLPDGGPGRGDQVVVAGHQA